MYLIFIVAISAIYFTFFFPFSYFRHDDWLILGNATQILEQNWRTAFHATLFYGNTEVVWFFRPLFKLLTSWFYRSFGLKYDLWLVALYLTFLLGVFLNYRTILLITDKRERGNWFVGAFCSFFVFHFGSLVWAGEGLMNIPQFFLLSLSTLVFLASFLEKKKSLLLLAAIFYLAALGFKESAVFHPVFLALLLHLESRFQDRPPVFKMLWISPLIGLTAAFIVFRIFYLPFHPAYTPFLKSWAWTKPSSYFFPIILGIVLGWSLLARDKGPASKKFFLYLGFVLLSISPYFGHGFFSVGWFLLFGNYLLFALVLNIRLPSRIHTLVYTGGLLVVSLFAIFLNLQKDQWWKWYAVQKQLQEIIEKAPRDQYKELVVFECTPSYELRFERVLAFEAGLHFEWSHFHAADIKTSIKPCTFLPQYQGKSDVLALRWEFPQLELLSKTHPSFQISSN